METITSREVNNVDMVLIYDQLMSCVNLAQEYTCLIMHAEATYFPQDTVNTCHPRGTERKELSTGHEKQL
jgi:hypothetical protein